MKHYKLLLCCVAAFASMNCSANRSSITCPESIEVNETYKANDKLWLVVIDKGRRGHFLESVMIYSGHPDEMASLIPDESSDNNQTEISTWNLIAAENEQFWIACAYSNTRVMLTQSLPKAYKQCQVTTALLPTGAKLKIESIICK